MSIENKDAVCLAQIWSEREQQWSDVVAHEQAFPGNDPWTTAYYSGMVYALREAREELQWQFEADPKFRLGPGSMTCAKLEEFLQRKLGKAEEWEITPEGAAKIAEKMEIENAGEPEIPMEEFLNSPDKIEEILKTPPSLKDV